VDGKHLLRSDDRKHADFRRNREVRRRRLIFRAFVRRVSFGGRDYMYTTIVLRGASVYIFLDLPDIRDRHRAHHHIYDAILGREVRTAEQLMRQHVLCR
jgi:DNA-binding GntR family transcriptional regulator